jgi:protein gp37
VWLGTTAENQKYADLRIPRLLEVPARIHFISAEPLLGPLSIRRWKTIDWVIAGGESGVVPVLVVTIAFLQKMLVFRRRQVGN